MKKVVVALMGLLIMSSCGSDTRYVAPTPFARPAEWKNPAKLGQEFRGVEREFLDDVIFCLEGMWAKDGDKRGKLLHGLKVRRLSAKVMGLAAGEQGGTFGAAWVERDKTLYIGDSLFGREGKRFVKGVSTIGHELSHALEAKEPIGFGQWFDYEIRAHDRELEDLKAFRSWLPVIIDSRWHREFERAELFSKVRSSGYRLRKSALEALSSVADNPNFPKLIDNSDSGLAIITLLSFTKVVYETPLNREGIGLIRSKYSGARELTEQVPTTSMDFMGLKAKMRSMCDQLEGLFDLEVKYEKLSE